MGVGASRAGTAGSERVARQLAPWRAHGWELLRDVHRPGRSGDVLEHVAVGPGGVIVIDVTDAATGAGQGQGPGGSPEDVAVMAASVSALLEPTHRTAVHGAIALADHDLPAMVVDAGTVVVGRRDLDAWRASLPLRLLAGDVAAVTRRLRATLGATEPPVQLSLRDLEPPVPRQ